MRGWSVLLLSMVLGVMFAWTDCAEAGGPARGELGEVADDVASLRAEVADLRAGLERTLAELKQRCEGERSDAAAGDESAEPTAERDAALRRLGARMEAVAAEQARLAERLRMAGEVRRDAADEPADSEAETQAPRVEATYTRYTGGYASGYYTVRANPRRTTARPVYVDPYPRHGLHVPRFHHRVHHPGLIHHRVHRGRFPLHHRSHYYHRHHRHAGLILGTSGDDFFLKVRLGHSVHLGGGQ